MRALKKQQAIMKRKVEALWQRTHGIGFFFINMLALLAGVGDALMARCAWLEEVSVGSGPEMEAMIMPIVQE